VAWRDYTSRILFIAYYRYFLAEIEENDFLNLNYFYMNYFFLIFILRNLNPPICGVLKYSTAAIGVF